MSDITGAVVALLALKNSGVLDALKDPSKKKFDWSWKPKEKEITPPTSDAGVRPQCAIGEKAKFNTQTDEWQCVPSEWD